MVHRAAHGISSFTATKSMLLITQWAQHKSEAE